MGQRVTNAANEMRQFLFKKVYNKVSSRPEAAKAREVVRQLYSYFIKYENELPAEYLLYSTEVERRVVDYIAGMTDQYALNIAEKLAF